MTNTISNADHVIDSRDVIARIEELESERSDIECDIETVKEETDGKPEIEREPLIAEATGALAEWDEENGDELKALKAFADEGNAEWKHGETLVRESYFEDYAQELADDIGAIPKDNAWPCTCIDWKQAARELRYDYTGAEFDGVTYYFRS